MSAKGRYVELNIATHFSRSELEDLVGCYILLSRLSVILKSSWSYRHYYEKRIIGNQLDANFFAHL